MKKILYIDKSESHRVLLKETLSEEGYEVFTSEYIEQALSQFSGGKPDLLILELRQKDTKKENLQKLRRQYPNIPFIGYSTYNQCPNELSEWVDFYLTKSSDTGEVKRLIKNLRDSRRV